jgi:hypothetical protein
MVQRPLNFSPSGRFRGRIGLWRAPSKGTGIWNIVRETVPRFIVFLVLGLFAGELRGGRWGLELGTNVWAFISVASIFFQNTVRQALDSRRLCSSLFESGRASGGEWLFGLLLLGRSVDSHSMEQRDHLEEACIIPTQ